MEELLKFVVGSLIDQPDQIELETKAESDSVFVVFVRVPKEDLGKVIGKNGKVADSIRTIVRSATAQSGKKYIIKFGEKEA